MVTDEYIGILIKCREYISETISKLERSKHYIEILLAEIRHENNKPTIFGYFMNRRLKSLRNKMVTDEYIDVLIMCREYISETISALNRRGHYIEEIHHENNDEYSIMIDCLESLRNIELMQRRYRDYAERLTQYITELSCASAPLVGNRSSVPVKEILDVINCIDDDDLAAIEDARKQAESITESITDAITRNASYFKNDQDSSLEIEFCRTQLTDTLRRKEAITVSESVGDQQISHKQNQETYDAIATFRKKFEEECMLGTNGNVRKLLNASESDSGFSPIGKDVASRESSSDKGNIQVPKEILAGSFGICRVCGAIINQSTNYCPECGTKAVIEKPQVQLDKVYFSAIAPKSLAKGDYSLIQIFMYEAAFRSVVDEALKDTDDAVKETKSGVMVVGKNAKITVVLLSPDIKIEDNREELIWYGEYLNFSFAIEMPEQFQKKQILFIATVYINDVIAAKLKFMAKCESATNQNIEIVRDDIMSAFISYASQDRYRVATIIQGMKTARPDMDIFFDVDSLRSGENWENKIWDEIDKRDVLYLCWSRYARESKWVDAEWRYAFERKGESGIEPIPIDPPRVCPPPDELCKKHFNDKLLYIINIESRMRKSEQKADENAYYN